LDLDVEQIMYILGLVPEIEIGRQKRIEIIWPVISGAIQSVKEV
jgi:hypothetical protein